MEGKNRKKARQPLNIHRVAESRHTSSSLIPAPVPTQALGWDVWGRSISGLKPGGFRPWILYTHTDASVL